MVLGCDIGTSFTKAVLFEDGKYLCEASVPTEANPNGALQRVIEKICPIGDIEENAVDEIVATGWGQSKLSRPHTDRKLINCLAKAAVWAEPTCRSVLCLGAQQSVALSVNPKGRVIEYQTSDKCASGAGKFIEIIVEALGCSVEETATIASSAEKQLTMSSQCAVFAESEVVSLINDGESVANILEAIFQSLSKNFSTLYKRIRGRDALILCGGMANNQRVLDLLRESLPAEPRLFAPDPSYIAAVGAALSGNGGAS